MELRGFKENIECVEKHMEFIYENLHEILEKLDKLMPENIELIQRVRGYVLQYYKEIQRIKLVVDLLSDSDVKNKDDKELILYVVTSLSSIRKKLRTIRKILHSLKNSLIDKEYEKLKEQFSNTKITLKEYSFPTDIASMLEEIMDCRGNIYAAERHISEFITATLNKFKKENE